MTQIDASYTFKNMTLGAQVENTKNYAYVADQTKQVMGVSAKAVFGKNALIANYSQQDVESGSNVTTAESKNVGLAVKHTLSKRTNFYLAFNKQETEQMGTTTESDNIALGMMHSF